MWLIYDIATGAQVGAAVETPPDPLDEGTAAVEVPGSALQVPPLTVWSAPLRGFVDTPAPVTVLTRLAFQRLFTAAERIAIRGSGDAYVQDFVALAALAQDIDLADPDTIAGVSYLETLEIIGAGRAAAVLAGESPA